MKCHYCHKFIKTEDTCFCYTHKSKHKIEVCPYCLYEYTTTCSICDRKFDNSNFHIMRKNKKRFYVCNNCYKNITGDCENCGNRYWKENLLEPTRYFPKGKYSGEKKQSDEMFCANCLKGFTICGGCNSTVNKYNMRSRRNNPNEFVCSFCYNTDYVIKPYSSQPTDYIPFLGNPQDKLYLGIELEVNIPSGLGRSQESVALEIEPYLDHLAIFTTDASIPYGFEIKSTPCSLEYHQKGWDKFFKYIESNNNILQIRGQNCGIHVHVSRNLLSPLHIGRIATFINDGGNRKLISKIAERESKYAKLYDQVKPTSYLNKTSDHHDAISTYKEKTIEFRIFASVIEKIHLLKDIEFSHAVVKFTNLENCSNFTDPKSFERFVGINKRTYPHLYAFLFRENYKQLKIKIEDSYDKASTEW